MVSLVPQVRRARTGSDSPVVVTKLDPRAMRIAPRRVKITTYRYQNNAPEGSSGLLDSL